MIGVFKDDVYFPLGTDGDDGMSEGEYQALFDPDYPDDVHDFEGDLSYSPNLPVTLSEKHGYWRTRDGRVLLIADMSDNHLDNAIKMFSKAGYSDFVKIQELREERKKR